MYRYSHPIAWNQGHSARFGGYPIDSNRYPEGSSSHVAWAEGWEAADEDEDAWERHDAG